LLTDPSSDGGTNRVLASCAVSPSRVINLACSSVRQMLRAGGRPGAVTAATVAPDQQSAVNLLASATVTMKAGERAGTALAQCQTESKRQRQRRGPRI